MKKISSTNAQNKFGSVLEDSKTEPVLITKNRKAVSVMVSWKEYQRLIALDESYWMDRAEEAAQGGYVDEGELDELLMDKFGVTESILSLIDFEVSKSAYAFIESFTYLQMRRVLDFIKKISDSKNKPKGQYLVEDLGKYRIIYEYVDSAPSIIYIGKLYYHYMS